MIPYAAWHGRFKHQPADGIATVGATYAMSACLACAAAIVIHSVMQSGGTLRGSGHPHHYLALQVRMLLGGWPRIQLHHQRRIVRSQQLRPPLSRRHCLESIPAWHNHGVLRLMASRYAVVHDEAQQECWGACVASAWVPSGAG